jgi:predicted nuclease of restriction endonuclease-like (RecB) superfamily
MSALAAQAYEVSRSCIHQRGKSLRRVILERQQQSGWGAKIIDHLASDLRQTHPEMKGLSPRNLKYMRAFAAAWPDRAVVQAPLAQLTWYHNIALLEKVDKKADRLLGTGFAFVGRHVSLEVGGQDFYLDLLFYHLKPRRYVIIELKAVPFSAEFVGQMNVYLCAADELLRHPDIAAAAKRSRRKRVTPLH